MHIKTKYQAHVTGKTESHSTQNVEIIFFKSDFFQQFSTSSDYLRYQNFFYKKPVSIMKNHD